MFRASAASSMSPPFYRPAAERFHAREYCSTFDPKIRRARRFREVARGVGPLLQLEVIGRVPAAPDELAPRHGRVQPKHVLARAFPLVALEHEPLRLEISRKL